MLTTRVPLACVVWDFDGVLNDNMGPAGFHWAAGFADHFGTPLNGFSAAVFGQDMPALLRGEADIRDRVAAWIDSAGVDTTPEAVITYWLERDLHPNAEVIALMKSVADRGLRQAVLSNCDSRRAIWLDAVMAEFPPIEAVFASARIGAAKPDPAAFAHVAQALDLPAGALMLIDDLPRNVNAAANAGWRSFRYSRIAHQALRRSLLTERL